MIYIIMTLSFIWNSDLKRVWQFLSQSYVIVIIKKNKKFIK